MKRSISILSVLAFVLAFSGSVFGQTTINANAEVLADLTVTQEQQIDFGLLSRGNWGTDPSVDPSDGSTSGDFEDASGVQVGFVSVSGTGDQSVDITVETSITLSGTSGDEMTLTPEYNWTYDDLTGGETSWTANGSNTTSNFSMTLDGTSQNDDGTNTILIGGTMSETNGSLTAETYSGTGEITVSYQ